MYSNFRISDFTSLAYAKTNHRRHRLTRDLEPFQNQDQSTCHGLVQDFLGAHRIKLFISGYDVAVAIHPVHVWSSRCSAILIVLELEPALQSVGSAGLSYERGDVSQNCFDQNND